MADEQDNKMDTHSVTCTQFTSECFSSTHNINRQYVISDFQQTTNCVTTKASAGALHKNVAMTQSCVVEVSSLIATPAQPTASPLYSLHVAFIFKTVRAGSL
jgi:hypothetical protein